MESDGELPERRQVLTFAAGARAIRLSLPPARTSVASSDEDGGGPSEPESVPKRRGRPFELDVDDTDDTDELLPPRRGSDTGWLQGPEADGRTRRSSWQLARDAGPTSKRAAMRALGHFDSRRRRPSRTPSERESERRARDSVDLASVGSSGAGLRADRADHDGTGVRSPFFSELQGGLEAGARSLAYAPDGSFLVAAGADGSVAVWRPPLQPRSARSSGESAADNRRSFAAGERGSGATPRRPRTPGSARSSARSSMSGGAPAARNSTGVAAGASAPPPVATGPAEDSAHSLALAMRLFTTAPLAPPTDDPALGAAMPLSPVKEVRRSGPPRPARFGAAATAAAVDEGPLPERAEAAVLSVAAVPDSRRFCAARADGSVAVVNAMDGRVVQVLCGREEAGHHNGRANAVAVDARAELVASAGEDGTVAVWRLGRMSSALGGGASMGGRQKTAGGGGGLGGLLRARTSAPPTPSGAVPPAPPGSSKSTRPSFADGGPWFGGVRRTLAHPAGGAEGGARRPTALSDTGGGAPPPGEDADAVEVLGGEGGACACAEAAPMRTRSVVAPPPPPLRSFGFGGVRATSSAELSAAGGGADSELASAEGGGTATAGSSCERLGEGTEEGSGGGAAELLVASMTRTPLHSHGWHSRRVLAVAFAPDGRLASGGADARVFVCDAQGGALLHMLELAHDEEEVAQTPSRLGATPSHSPDGPSPGGGRARLRRPSRTNSRAARASPRAAALAEVESEVLPTAGSGVQRADSVLKPSALPMRRKSSAASASPPRVDSSGARVSPLRSRSGGGPDPDYFASGGADGGGGAQRRSTSGGGRSTSGGRGVASGGGGGAAAAARTSRARDSDADGVASLAFAPDDGGTLLAVGCMDGLVILFNSRLGERLRTLDGHLSAVTSVDWSGHAPTLLASGSADKQVLLWDPHTGTLLRRLSPRPSAVLAVRFAPPPIRLHLAVATDGSSPCLFDLASPAQLETLQPEMGAGGWVWSIAFSADGLRVATASAPDEFVQVWDGRTGARDKELFGHTDAVTAVAFSAEAGSALLASASRDATVALWDAATGVRHGALEGHTEPVYAIAFAPDGRRLASASKDTTVRVWDAWARVCVCTCRGHTHRVWGVAWAPDASVLASASWDMSLIVWEMRQAPTARRQKGRGGARRGAQPGARAAGASGSSESASSESEEEAGAPASEVAPLDLDALSEPAAAAAPPPTEPRAAAVGGGGGAAAAAAAAAAGVGSRRRSSQRGGVSELPQLEALALVLDGHAGQLKAVAFAPDCVHVATGGWDRAVTIWDFRRGERVRTLGGLRAYVSEIAFSPDGDLLAIGSHDRAALLVDWRRGRLQRTLRARGRSRVTALAFEPDGRSLAVGTDGGEVTRWHSPVLAHPLPSFVSLAYALDADSATRHVGYDDYPWPLVSEVAARLHPQAIAEPDGADAARRALVHRAAAAGHASFCRRFLALFPAAALALDADGRSVLSYALEANSAAVASAVVDGIVRAAEVDRRDAHSDRGSARLVDNLDVGDLPGLAKVAPKALARLAQLEPVQAFAFVRGSVTTAHFPSIARNHLLRDAPSSAPRELWAAERRVRAGPTPVGAYVLPLQRILAPHGFLAACVTASAELADSKVFTHSLPKYCVQHKWESFGARLYNIELGFYAALLAANLALVLALRVVRADSLAEGGAAAVRGVETPEEARFDVPRIVRAALHADAAAALEDGAGDDAAIALPTLCACTAALTLGFSARETVQLWFEGLEYLSDGWNWIALTTYVQQLLLAALAATMPAAPIVRDLVLISQPMLWINALFFMRAREGMGQLVRMIVVIIQDIGFLIFIFMWLLVPFTIAFYLALGGAADEYAVATGLHAAGGSGDFHEYAPYANLWRAFVQTFRGALGSFESLELLFGAGTVAVFMYTLFTVMQMIVLLNMLVALMSDSYEKIKEDETAEFTRQRAIVCLEYERMFGHVLRTPGPWLHVLRPLAYAELDAYDVWRGLAGKVENLERHVSATSDGLGAKVDAMAAALSARDEHVERMMAMLTQRVVRLGRSQERIVSALATVPLDEAGSAARDAALGSPASSERQGPLTLARNRRRSSAGGPAAGIGHVAAAALAATHHAGGGAGGGGGGAGCGGAGGGAGRGDALATANSAMSMGAMSSDSFYVPGAVSSDITVPKWL